MLRKHNYSYVAKQLENKARSKPEDKTRAENEAISYMSYQTQLNRCHNGFCDHTDQTYRQCKKAVINKLDLAPALLSEFNNRYTENRIYQTINSRLLESQIIDSSESATMGINELKAFIKEKTKRKTQKAYKINTILANVREEVLHEEK